MTHDTSAILPIGTRITIRNNWEWPDGTTGTVTALPDWVIELHGDRERLADLALLYHHRDGPHWHQYIAFDELTDDGSGDGPYRGGVVDVANLHPIDADRP